MGEPAFTLTTDQLRALIADALREELPRLQPARQLDVMNLEQAAEFLGRSTQMVMRYVRKGRLIAHFISSREARFYRRDLFSFIDALPTRPGEESEGDPDVG